MKHIRENQIEKGWMLKMAGISIYPEAGLIVVRKYERYLVKSRIDSGGNGVVFAVDVISEGSGKKYHEKEDKSLSGERSS